MPDKQDAAIKKKTGADAPAKEHDRLEQARLNRPGSPDRRRSGLLPGLAVGAVLLGVPLLVLFYQAQRTGLSVGQLFAHLFKGAGKDTEGAALSVQPHGKQIDFLSPATTGYPASDPPRIGSITMVDLDHLGLMDIPVCDRLHFDDAVWIKPDDVKAHHALGFTLAGLKRNDEAVAAFRQSLKLKLDFQPAQQLQKLEATRPLTAFPLQSWLPILPRTSQASGNPTNTVSP